jgi:hypothetical protein
MLDRQNEFTAHCPRLVKRRQALLESILKGIGFMKQVVATDTIGALSAKEYPNLRQEIVRSTSECLQDGFDLVGFVEHYASSEEQFFPPW